ncbi:tyrosine-protein phosphatase [Planctomycetota bacterium]
MARQFQVRTSKVLVRQLLLVHALYYGLGIGTLYASGFFIAVVPGEIYRSGKPDLEDIPKLVQKYGIKTVVNLRGHRAPGVAEETEVVTGLGIAIEHVDLSAYRLMRSDRLLKLIRILETAERPLLIHCNHGVDRSGTASAIAAWLVGGMPYASAKWHAFVPPGPWKHRAKISPHHVSETLDQYEAYCESLGVGPDDRAQFKHWAAHEYYHVE